MLLRIANTAHTSRNVPSQTVESLESKLDARFGSFMTTAEVAEALKITVPALRMARSRKRFPLLPLDVKGRKSLVYSTHEVASLLATWVSRPTEVAM